MIGTGREFNGYNLFVYSTNNYINFIDNSGKGPIKWIAQQMWKGVVKILKSWNYTFAANFLEHSVSSSKPDDLYYDKDSSISKAISKDSDFQNKMEEIICNNNFHNGKIKYDSTTSKTQTGMEFNNNFDLFASIHGANIIINDSISDMKLSVQLVDYYDFKFERGYHNYKQSKMKNKLKTLMAVTGNNLAWSDQFFGVVNNYYINIEVEYDLRGKTCNFYLK